MGLLFWCLVGVVLFYLALYVMLGMSYKQNLSA